MCPNILRPLEAFTALWALVRPLSCVFQDKMLFEALTKREALSTGQAFVRLLFSVSHLMPPEACFIFEFSATRFAGERLFIRVHPLVTFQTLEKSKTLWAAITCMWKSSRVYQLMRLNVSLLTEALSTNVAFKWALLPQMSVFLSQPVGIACKGLVAFPVVLVAGCHGSICGLRF